MKVCVTLGDFEKVREGAYITNMYFLSNGNLCVHYEPLNPDGCVTSPSYLGSLVLAYSRRLMDVYLDEIDAYRNPATTFIRTDTDSIFVNEREEQKLKKYILPELMKNLSGKGSPKTIAKEKQQLKYDSLGLLDYDIDGKITQYGEPCPKCYCACFTRPDDTTDTHIKTKGISKEEKNQLTFSDFQAMLGKGVQERSIETNRGSIEIRDGQIKVQQRDKIKRVGLSRLNSTQLDVGFENSSIASIPFSRTLNKNVYRGRRHIVGHPEMFSLCHGSTKLLGKV